MRNLKSFIVVFSLAVLAISCKDQLDVKNPNQPAATSINSENNITSLGLGVYASGFRNLKYGGYQGTFVTDVFSFHEIMGDVIGCEAANVYINQLGMPDVVTLDNNSQLVNPATPNTQLALIRTVNKNGYADQNPIYYEWAYMYALNNACNAILANVDAITYSGDNPTKKNTLKAWAYWWKGYAYSRIGSVYYAGIINDGINTIINDYVSKEALIAEAGNNLDKATAALSAITVTADYTSLMKSLVPTVNQIGKGVVPTVDMWKRSINTLKARNILVNTKASAMTSTQWNSILSLTNSGLLSTDNVFTGRSSTLGEFMGATGGCVALLSALDPGNATYKISERLIQDFKTGDKRLANNFSNAVTGGLYTGDASRGTIFNTRWKLLDGGAGLSGVIVLANRTAPNGEVFLATTYEENELMKAEAKIYLGDIAGGLASIDAVRTAQGAGLTAVSGTSTDPVFAKEELRKERRVGLAFRALSFYDARRWGVIDNVSAGGGRSNAVVVDKYKTVNTNATINYNYLDYWDVPDNELVYNTPSATSAPVKNPRQQ